MTIKSKKPGSLDLRSFPPAKRTNFWRSLYEDASGQPVRIPLIVARGSRSGPTVGVTAAIHGNELNGIRIIHHLMEELDLDELAGSLVCVPVVNIPSYNLGQREFPDGLDLNHVFPGHAQGKPSEQYARAFVDTVLPSLDYLIDIHTASEGRINTMYVRADLSESISKQMALDFNPQIILDSRSGDGTLRGAARRRKIPAITVEAGNPSVIQGRMVFEGESGVRNVLRGLGMLSGDLEKSREPVLCSSSRWLRTTGGGLLQTKFKLMDQVKKRQTLATIYNLFGEVTASYKAPSEGIVIGMSVNPSAEAGTRYCHLGQVESS